MSTETEQAIEEAAREAAKTVRLAIGEVLAFNGVLHVDEIEARIATAITAAVAKACEPHRQLAERAVVALHMHFHGSINGPLFPECRKDLCGDWHRAALNQEQPQCPPT